MKLRLFAALALFVSFGALGADRAWSIQVPAGATVSYRGLANFDAAGQGQGAMLYPAFGLAGFVAAVVTHGVLVEGMKSSERTRIQEQADQVLVPFRPLLDGFTHEDLMTQGVSRLSIAGAKRLVVVPEPQAPDWIIETTPEFAMTQDKRALVLDNTISVYPWGQRDAPAYRNVIRVVSAPTQSADDVDAHWTEDQGRRLKQASAGMWAESVEIAIGHMSAPATEGPSKTVRYPQGGSERMERAELLLERCDRLLIRTLRGELMSVPRRTPVACPSGGQ